MVTPLPDRPSGQATYEAEVRRLELTGYALAAWSFIFMLPHLYWALGGRSGLAAVHPGAPELAQWRLINWVAVVSISVVSSFCLTFAPLSRTRIGRWTILAVVGIGCSLAVSHAFYGIGDRASTVLDHVSGPPNSREIPAYILVDLFVFEPWFLIEGILLGMAGWFLLADKAHRRRWLAACVGGTSLALGAALLNLKIG